MHGYTSDSDSEDEYNQAARGAVPAGSTPVDPAKAKKKKPKMPPQLRINRIWKRFSNRKFTKALAVLPFEPVQPSAVSDRANELLGDGYRRAADECSRKVDKIIEECRRVNMRYRDPGWDLDWDLKYEKGHCLNSLGRTKFELSMSNLLNPSALVPKAVKRVHEIFDKPTFMEKLSGSEVKQGSLGDCWLMASLSGLANVPAGLQRICVKYDTRIGIYGFVFYRDGEWIYSIIDDKLYLKSPTWDSPSMQRDLLQQIDREDVERVYRKTYQTGSKALFFAQCKDQNETWAPLIEKAYAKAHGDYASLSGGWIGEGLEDLSGGVTTELLASDILDLEGFWENELSRVNEEFLFGCSTGLLDGGYGDRDGISEGHAYVVMESRTLKNGTRLVKLRNPWGKNKKGIWEGAWSDGSKEWTTEVQEELGHNFGSDSVFWISYEDLLRKYQHFDRTRLFRDADWRCCQRWIGVEVPWKPQYNEKFHIKLTKESPLVLVLSQLDSRYFKGLTGQYSFRLHFRLHERGRPGAEDYIVRSHGNYLMDRSVSIELPAMAAGQYSVFISVVGERDTAAPSVEDVVRRECRRRVENEKLVQVGHAYDLAHSKGVAHLEAVAAARKRAEQKKASASRREERRKMWEKRHLNRDIGVKQAKKNKEKMKPRKTAAVEEWKKSEAAKKEEYKKKKADKEAAKEKKKQEKEAEEAAKKAAEEGDKKEDEQKPKEAELKNKEAANEPAVVDTDKADLKNKEANAPAVVDADKAAPTEQTTTSTAPAETPTETAEDQAGGDTASAGSSDTSGSPKNTPKSDGSATPVDGLEQDKDKVPVPPVDPATVPGGPPSSDTAPAPATTEPKPAQTEEPSVANTCKCACCKSADASPAGPEAQPAKSDDANAAGSKNDKDKDKEKDDSGSSSGYSSSAFENPADSSDSPVSDWEALYSSDDMARKPRNVQLPPATGSKWREESDDDAEPDPWNAICIVGFRVYSKDEGLELRVVLEGGEMEEGGMGEKGEADLDNAQANAGGERGKIGARGTKDGKDAKEGKKEDDGGYECDTEDGEKKKRSKREKSKVSDADKKVDENAEGKTDGKTDGKAEDKVEDEAADKADDKTDKKTDEETKDMAEENSGKEEDSDKGKADDDFEVIDSADGLQAALASKPGAEKQRAEGKGDGGFSSYPTIVQKKGGEAELPLESPTPMKSDTKNPFDSQGTPDKEPSLPEAEVQSEKLAESSAVNVLSDHDKNKTSHKDS